MLTDVDPRPRAKTVASLWLELEPRCNLRCQFCFNYWKDGQHPVPGRLPVAELLACLDVLLDEIQCDKAALSGGEPLLYPGLDEVVTHLHARGITTILTTNGVLLTEQRLRALVRAGLDGVQIPLHAADPARQDELTGGSSWEASVRALLLARRLDVPATPVFVATRRNVSELASVVQLLWLLGLQRLIVNRFVPGGLGLLYEDSLWMDDEQFVSELIKADAAAVRFGCTIELGVPVPPEARAGAVLPSVVSTSCPVGGLETQLTVDSEGNLKECSQSPVALGSLVDQPVSELLRRRSQTTYGAGEVKPCEFCPSGGPSPKARPLLLGRRPQVPAG